MISGAHIVLYSKNPEADRDLFRDLLELKSVAAGGGGRQRRPPLPTEAPDGIGQTLACDPVQNARPSAPLPAGPS